MKCVKAVKADKYTTQSCELFLQPVQNSPSKVTLKDVLTKPVSTPATPVERKMTEHLVWRLLDKRTEGNMIIVPTRGQITCDYLQYIREKNSWARLDYQSRYQHLKFL